MPPLSSPTVSVLASNNYVDVSKSRPGHLLLFDLLCKLVHWYNIHGVINLSCNYNKFLISIGNHTHLSAIRE